VPGPDHIPVLLEAVVATLDPAPGGTLVDCTAGLGGHAAAIARRLGPAGRVVLMDLDAGNLARAAAAVRDALGSPDPASVVPVHASFAWAASEMTARGLVADYLLADLGFASNQMDDPARGLSIRRPGPLDMRLDPSAGATAARLVAETPEADLADLIYRFGEERLSRRIARAIVRARDQAPIETTERLAEIVSSAFPPKSRHGRIHPATRTFQALRIAVNDEIGSLESLLASIERQAGPEPPARWLAEGARVAIISFHSLEDRPVKQAFRRLAESNSARLINRKPLVADQKEIAANARARSAKLRALALTREV
jgi:16S rRNA (cytosine1402-N4)-methyltransferase